MDESALRATAIVGDFAEAATAKYASGEYETSLHSRQ